jgi:hypothetical protein
LNEFVGIGAFRSHCALLSFAARKKEKKKVHNPQANVASTFRRSFHLSKKTAHTASEEKAKKEPTNCDNDSDWKSCEQIKKQRALPQSPLTLLTAIAQPTLRTNSPEAVESNAKEAKDG